MNTPRTASRFGDPKMSSRRDAETRRKNPLRAKKLLCTTIRHIVVFITRFLTTKHAKGRENDRDSRSLCFRVFRAFRSCSILFLIPLVATAPRRVLCSLTLCCAGFLSFATGAATQPATATNPTLVRAGFSPRTINDTNRNDSVFRIGFSSSMFTDVNENDAKAAVKVWAQTIARERGIETDPDPSILTGLDELASALRNKQVDMISLLAEEYCVLNADIPLAPLFVAYVNGKVEEEVVLLVRSDSGTERVEDLKGRHLITHSNPRASLAIPWLNSILLEKGLRPTAEFMGRVSQNTKLSSVVLPVFFRQSDACLVTRTGFDTMSELNPQIGKALKVLATSPKVVPILLCFRADYAPAFNDKILAGLRDLHLSPAGQQILTIFQSEKLEEIPATGLQSTLDFLTHCEELRKASGMDSKTGMASQVGSMTEGRP